MKAGRLGSVFSSYYFRASLMNPYLVYSLNKTVLKGTRIFTPTLGWSAYCHGFLSCAEVEEYVGTDVIPSVCEKTEAFITAYHPTKKDNSRVYCRPSEDLLVDADFLATWTGHFDTVFFSPPYYRLELYEGADQSTTRYKTYDEWLEKYWAQTVELCYRVLQPGGRLCYILSGYGSKSVGQQYDLITDMNRIVEKRFTLLNIYPMMNKDVHVTKHKETAEKIMVFKKKE